MSTLRLGDIAPDFTANTSQGTLNFYDYLGDSWGMMALSVDGADSHNKWILDINETQQTVVNFPIVADEDKKVSNLYDMIHPNADDTLTVRSVFIVAPDKTIKLILTYPASTGRNFYELLRVIDSLQLTAYHKVATPANWKNGDAVVVSPSISTEDAKEIFPKGVEEIKPYLRMTPDPKS
jgi:alkyl hydroperoxide reductase subunit AhpC